MDELRLREITLADYAISLVPNGTLMGDFAVRVGCYVSPDVARGGTE